MLDDALSPTIEFACPRCATTVDERFYGPCAPCRAALSATLRRDATEMTSERFEPKINVVPNHVATKD